MYKLSATLPDANSPTGTYVQSVKSEVRAFYAVAVHLVRYHDRECKRLRLDAWRVAVWCLTYDEAKTRQAELAAREHEVRVFEVTCDELPPG